VQIEIAGPTGQWFGVGFDAPNFLMADFPYAIIVEGAGFMMMVSEVKLNTPEVGHGPGTLLEPSVEVVSIVEEDGNTVVTLSRAKEGQTSDHYTFDASVASIPLIIASGAESEFGYHGPDTKSGETMEIFRKHQEKREEKVSAKVEGTVSSTAAATSMTLVLDESDSSATITLSGPSGVWFGVGFDAPNFVMADNPYAIIVDGAGEVSERKLDAPGIGHGPGSLLSASIEVLSAVDEEGFKTVVLRRALAGASSDHYSFDVSKPSIPLLIASGTTPDYAHHGADTKSGETLNLG